MKRAEITATEVVIVVIFICFRRDIISGIIEGKIVAIYGDKKKYIDNKDLGELGIGMAIKH